MLLIFNISLATNHLPGLIQSVLEIFLKGVEVLRNNLNQGDERPVH